MSQSVFNSNSSLNLKEFPSDFLPPKHVAIIMDGNRRWAKHHGLELIQGHKKVAQDVIEKLVDHAILRGIKYLTLWAFSTENWQRSQLEVQGLMALFREAFGEDAQKFHNRGVRLQTIGDIKQFPSDIQAGVARWLKLTTTNTAITVTLALGYGGRDELIRAIRRLVEDEVLVKNLPPAQITAEKLVGFLDTHDLPDPDLIIRPGGERRLSGFLPWQSVYSELYFTETLMPDFTETELDAALLDFAKRRRRFGA